METVVKKFSQLTTEELYEILRVRAAVFVVEQNCAYQDLDGVDLEAYHVFLKEDGKIITLTTKNSIYKICVNKNKREMMN